jgi:hypothetical protein
MWTWKEKDGWNKNRCTDRVTGVHWRNGGLSRGCMEVERTGKHGRSQMNAVWVVNLRENLKEKEAWKWEEKFLFFYFCSCEFFLIFYYFIISICVLNEFDHSLHKKQGCGAVWIAFLVFFFFYFKNNYCEVG